MSQIHIDISGLERLRDALRRAPASVVNEVGKAVQKSAYTIQSNAIKEAPVNKRHGGGNLRQNIKVHQLTKTKAVIRSAAPYSLFVEEGTKPHLIRIKDKRALADKREGIIFGTQVHHPGTQPNPYMKRALEKSTPNITVFFKQAISAIFNRLKV